MPKSTRPAPTLLFLSAAPGSGLLAETARLTSAQLATRPGRAVRLRPTHLTGAGLTQAARLTAAGLTQAARLTAGGPADAARRTRSGMARSGRLPRRQTAEAWLLRSAGSGPARSAGIAGRVSARLREATRLCWTGQIRSAALGPAGLARAGTVRLRRTAVLDRARLIGTTRLSAGHHRCFGPVSSGRRERRPVQCRRHPRRSSEAGVHRRRGTRRRGEPGCIERTVQLPLDGRSTEDRIRHRRNLRPDRAAGVSREPGGAGHTALRGLRPRRTAGETRRPTRGRRRCTEPAARPTTGTGLAAGTDQAGLPAVPSAGTAVTRPSSCTRVRSGAGLRSESGRPGKTGLAADARLGSGTGVHTATMLHAWPGVHPRTGKPTGASLPSYPTGFLRIRRRAGHRGLRRRPPAQARRPLRFDRCGKAGRRTGLGAESSRTSGARPRVGTRPAEEARLAGRTRPGVGSAPGVATATGVAARIPGAAPLRVAPGPGTDSAVVIRSRFPGTTRARRAVQVVVQHSPPASDNAGRHARSPLGFFVPVAPAALRRSAEPGQPHGFRRTAAPGRPGGFRPRVRRLAAEGGPLTARRAGLVRPGGRPGPAGIP